MKNQHLLALFIFSLGLTTVLCGLKIASPSDLKAQFPEGIKHQNTRFGRIPSGSSLTGTFIVANPVDGCTNIKNDLFRQEQVPIYIVRHGGCRYIVKANSAQSAGAKMLVIIDENDALPKDPVGQDRGENIQIPTIIIGKKDGDKLIQAVEKATKAKSSVIATMSFPYGIASNTVSLQYFFSSADTTNNAYKFIRDFKEFYLKAGEQFQFEPHYVTWYCAPCRDADYKEPNEDCVSGGRYCAPDPDSEGPLKGVDVVMEDLRQICLWKKFPNTWWNYVDKFEKCINSAEQKNCGARVLKDVGLSSNEITTIDKCVEESFEGSNGYTNKERADNSILRDERAYQDGFDISMFPTLFINYQQYMGSLGDATSVFKAACESLQTPTALCNQYFQDRVYINTFDTGSIITFTLVLLVIVIIILFFYRRMARREMTKEMSIQVSQMVSQYFALNDLNESKGKADQL